MAMYGYRCVCGHTADRFFPMGEAAQAIQCECGRQMLRDFSTITVRHDDAFRRAWLSSDTDKALAEQQRAMDPLAPKDKFEAKHVHEETGRIYIGDDLSLLRPKSREAIIKGQREKGLAVG